MHSLDRFAIERLAELDKRQLRRALTETAPQDGAWVIRNGRRLLSFSSNDYLNLTCYETIHAASIAAIHQYGSGSGASRLVTGNHPLYAQLETRLARFKRTQACCVFGSGYLANSGIIPALIGREDLILIDEFAHACIWAGATLSRATTLPFRHNDVAHAKDILAEHRSKHPHALIATDGVFSMDGDLAPLAELSELAQNHDAWLLSDDAHGIGVLGNGRGSNFADGHHIDVPLQMGTLSKAIGGYGGYLCASNAVIELIRNRARTLIYSTGLPPATIAAAIAAIDLIERNPDLTSQPLAKAKMFTRLLGLTEAKSPIVPILIGSETATLKASALLEDEGFLVVAIRPPTVPAGTARLRVTFTAAHPDTEIERLARIIHTRILDR